MKPLHWLILLIVYAGCIEPFEPDIGSYDETLVIDGIFSNDNTGSRVVISRSFDFSSNEPEYVSGAVVNIEDDSGLNVPLVESSPGIYESDPNVLQGQIGKSYRLLVSTPDGAQFESTWEVMNESPVMDDVSGRIEQKIPNDPTKNPERGMQFYLTSDNAESNSRHYRWEWEETYEYLNLQPQRIRATFGDNPGNGNDEIVDVPNDEFEGFRCWKTEVSKDIIIATTENLETNTIFELPINFVDNSTPDLYTQYSLLVKQYAISEKYYEFLRSIEELNETTGGLFDAIPNEVFGNITSTTNPEINVLGYFGVAGISEKRIFVGREDLPIGFGSPPGPPCEVDTLPLDFQELYDRTRTGFQVLFDYNRNLFGIPIGYLISTPECIFCRENDATNVRPDYWP